MQNSSNVNASDNLFPITFSSKGPEGFNSRRDVLPFAKLVQGKPFGADHIYFERKESGLMSGIWRSEPYEERYDSYPCDEFMVMLSGETTVGNESGEVTYKTGDAFLIPKGFRGFWRQTVAVEKYYVIVGTPLTNNTGSADG